MSKEKNKVVSKSEQRRVAVQSATRNPVGHSVKDLNDNLADFEEFEGVKILEVLSVSISEDQEPTYKAVVSGGKVVDIPADHFNS